VRYNLSLKLQKVDKGAIDAETIMSQHRRVSKLQLRIETSQRKTDFTMMA